MNPKVIHQLVAGFRRGDAISNEALLMRSVFRSWGCKSDILCEGRRISGDAKHEVRDFKDASAELGPEDIAILHLSIGCQLNLEFPKLKCRKVILYHNVTPDSYFRYLNPVTAADLALGRRHVSMLTDAAELSLADSAFNAGELTEAGYRNVSVFPFAVDIDSFKPGKADATTASRLRDGKKNILFVGRCVPNKKIEDLLTAVYFLSNINPNVRFIHVGAIATSECYNGLVKAHAKALGLQNVMFMNSVSQDVLNACYESADAFLCLSEHEGFCAPLIEAMLHQIPVLSLASAAIPETLGGAGVLFSAPPDFIEIAETVNRVITDENLKKAIIAKQNQRVELFRQRNIDSELKTLLASLL